MKTLAEVVKKKTAVFAFGRMNPPTTGHEKLTNKILSVARQNSATPFLFVSHTQDAKKNPLSSKEKVKYLKLGIPTISDHVVYDLAIKTPFDAVGYLIENGFTNVIMVAGDDRVSDFKKNIGAYVNHPDPEKSLDLDSFKVVSAGERDPDSDGVAGMSASKMREAVSHNDYETFKKGVPSKLSDRYAKEMFNAIKRGMHIVEMFEQVQRLSNSLNIPRNKMPQIKRDYIPDFIKMLKHNGVSVSTRELSVKNLKPTQNQINLDKVKEKYEKFADGKEVKPFIVSYDNYILDGHHQLFALKTLDSDQKVPCFVVNIVMRDLLQFAHDYPKTTYKEIDD